MSLVVDRNIVDEIRRICHVLIPLLHSAVKISFRDLTADTEISSINPTH